MARKNSRKSRTPKALAPAAKLRAFTVSARKAILKRLAGTREMVASKTATARQQALARADAARARTVDAVSGLEKMFEQRVARAISALGVPSSRDVQALSRQVAQLRASVEQLKRARARA